VKETTNYPEKINTIYKEKFKNLSIYFSLILPEAIFNFGYN